MYCTHFSHTFQRTSYSWRVQQQHNRRKHMNKQSIGSSNNHAYRSGLCMWVLRVPASWLCQAGTLKLKTLGWVIHTAFGRLTCEQKPTSRRLLGAVSARCKAQLNPHASKQTKCRPHPYTQTDLQWLPLPECVTGAFLCSQNQTADQTHIPRWNTGNTRPGS